MEATVKVDIDVYQAFSILCKAAEVAFTNEPPKFSVNEDGVIVCDYDDRGELYLAIYHLATKLAPNSEFRNLFDDPNGLMSDLYLEKLNKISEEAQCEN